MTSQAAVGSSSAAGEPEKAREPRRLSSPSKPIRSTALPISFGNAARNSRLSRMRSATTLGNWTVQEPSWPTPHAPLTLICVWSWIAEMFRNWTRPLL
jgi:hypothetical protein